MRFTSQMPRSIMHRHALPRWKPARPCCAKKPMALSVAEADQVIRAAKTSNMLCMEGLWTLLLPAYRNFIEVARSGDLGPASNLVADFGYPAPAQTALQAYAKARGGVLLDRCIYLIALALTVLGPVERIDAQLDFEDSGVDKDAFLQLRHRGGSHSQLAASFDGLMANTATLSCSRGSLRLEAPLIGSEGVSTGRQTPAASSAGQVGQPASLRGRIVARLRGEPSIASHQPSDHAAGLPTPSIWGRSIPAPNRSLYSAAACRRARERHRALELSLAIQRIIEGARAAHRVR